MPLTGEQQLGVDCEVCGAAWAVCRGLCAEHDLGGGRPGPYHDAATCPECRAERIRMSPERQKALEAVLEATARYIRSVQRGVPQLAQKGAQSSEFRATSDQTAAAWSDMKAAVAAAETAP